MALDRNGHRPLRICFVINSVLGFPPHVGGLSISAYRITQHLVQAGFDVHVVTTEKNQPADTVSRDHGLTVHRISLKDDFASVFALPHYLRKLDAEVNFDLFHAFFLTSVPSCKSVIRSAQDGRLRPMIASIRGSDLVSMLETPRSRPAMLSAFAQPNCWITSVNQQYLDYVARLVDITGRGSVIRNGAPEASHRWRLTEQSRGTVGTLGEFRKVKDIPLMVRGFAGMRPEHRLKLLLVGDFKDPLEEQWSMTLLQENGLLQQTERTGFLPHKQAFEQLARMNVYVQTSAAEGMPNALLEAAAFGVPIVATAVGGVKEVFTNEQDALLVPHAEPRQLSAALDRIVANPDLASTLASNAARLCEVYSAEREKAAWLALYESVMASQQN